MGIVSRVLTGTSRIGIANRGEPAIRFIRAVREYNARTGAQLETAAFYIDIEKDAPFVQEADITLSFTELRAAKPYRQGPAKQPAATERSAGNPYMDKDLLLYALAEAECDAVWVGWGFLSEDAAFVRGIEESGIIFIGPSAASMELLGDKVQAKRTAEDAGVPIVPWSRNLVPTVEEAREAAEEIGFPCIIKAANAGGGRGIRFVHTPDELETRYRSAYEETVRVTGGGDVFIERLVEKGRHLEVQVLADYHGHVSTFGVRDCSVQRRNQKIIEETPPPHMKKDEIAEIEGAAKRLIETAGYHSAGTVEFLYDIRRKEFYFMEVNTRLQVEHPITEELYGVDLVEGQIRIAFGEGLEDDVFTPRGAVVEARLNAEDPDQGFTPSPGRVARLRPPAGPGIRFDSGIQEGTEIPAEFDSMVAKIIAAGKSREQAFARLTRALTELRIRIEGGTTNRAFLLQLLGNSRMREGGVHTRFVEEFLEENPEAIRRPHWDIALLAAAVEEYSLRREAEVINFKQQLAFNGQPRDISGSGGMQINLSAEGTPYQLFVKNAGGEFYHIEENGKNVVIRYAASGRESVLTQNKDQFRIQAVRRGDALQCEVDGTPYRIGIESSGYVSAPSPAIVLTVHAEPGMEVRDGDVLATLEAMKMEMIVTAPESGTVTEVLVKPGEQVAAGQHLLQVEPEKSEKEPAAEKSRRAEFDTVPDNSPEQWDLLEREYRAVFLGFDHRPEAVKILKYMEAFTERNPESKDALLRTLTEGITMYAEIETLFSTAHIETEEFAGAVSFNELLSHYFRRETDRGKGLPDAFLKRLENALRLYPETQERDPESERRALFSMYTSHGELEEKRQLLHHTLFAVEQFFLPKKYRDTVSDALDRIVMLTQMQDPSLADAAYHARYVLVDKAVLEELRTAKKAKVGRILDLILAHAGNRYRYERHMRNIIDSGHYVNPDLVRHTFDGEPERSKLAWEILARRFTRDREFIEGRLEHRGGIQSFTARSRHKGKTYTTVLFVARPDQFKNTLQLLSSVSSQEIIILLQSEQNSTAEYIPAQQLFESGYRDGAVSVGLYSPERLLEFRHFTSSSGGILEENTAAYNMNPVQVRELRLDRLARFEQEQLWSSDSVFLLKVTAKDNPRDERLIALVDVPSARMELDEDRTIRRMVPFEHALMDAVFAMRAEQAKRKRRLYWNRIVIHMRAVLSTTIEQVRDYAEKIVYRMEDLGLEKFTVYSRRPSRKTGGIEEIELDFENISGTNFTLKSRPPSSEPLRPMDDYIAKVVRARQRGTVYPYEIVKMITRPGYQVAEPFPKGDFEEYDIEIDPDTGEQHTVSVKTRPYGNNRSNVIFGIIINYLENHPHGVRRALLLSDTTRDMGSLAENECRRIIAALDLAEELDICVEWLPVSAGARIDMESGTENLDWTARALQRIIRFTQAGGEINVIVSGISVGAQSYWNAEATMLMHTRGLLIMTEDAAMLLTGKKALDFSGSVSAEDNIGIGGLKRIMGPNGQAQIAARNLYEAYSRLFEHYELTYRPPHGKYPVRIESSDPEDRNIGTFGYNDFLSQGFSSVGDIFSAELNPERKKPFDMRQVMKALIDQDAPHLERWAGLRGGETAIVWESRIGGYASGLIGIESRSLNRIGSIPHDGPESWSGGTLYPLSSKKAARGINAFSGKLPLVILANLSGFDGSPESLRKLQLEYGAEIGRAVVNFDGPIIFVVTARYHGGAYVVFSKALNPGLHAVALEGSYASVIGGAPAAAVVFPRQVRKAVYSDPRVLEAQKKLREGAGITQAEVDELIYQVHAEKQKETADRFNSIHSVERAKKVGSIDEIISIADLRKYIAGVIGNRPLTPLDQEP